MENILFLMSIHKKTVNSTTLNFKTLPYTKDSMVMETLVFIVYTLTQIKNRMLNILVYFQSLT